jgi:hypothetical protein
MITPALFMTANASLIISTSNRVARVVDRVRALNALSDELSRSASDLDFRSERLAHLDGQLHWMERRARAVRIALTTLYVAFAMFVGTSLSLAVDVLVGQRIAALPTATAMIGVSLLLVACVFLVREALTALSFNNLESSFFQELRRRREATETRTP